VGVEQREMAMDTNMDVVIVGGGLGGLAVAVGLQGRGIRAEVFEKAPKVRPHNGTAISLAANGNHLMPANLDACTCLRL
jgi:2-polyprenyl-6-methoxyphenol hydroxylase-like FAD-dependent oxidoreductase